MRLTLTLLALLASSTTAHANDAGACYSINDMDARNFCIAKGRKDPSICYAIQRPDLRAACLAEVRR